MKTLIKNIVILSIFILGYICGNIGIDAILSSFILKISKLEIIEIIGFTSSIVL